VASHQTVDLPGEGWLRTRHFDTAYTEWVSKLVQRLADIQARVRNNLGRAHRNAELTENRGPSMERSFQVADTVLVRILRQGADDAREKFVARWRGPAVITERINDVTYRIREVDTDVEQVQNIRNLKKYHMVSAHSDQTRNELSDDDAHTTPAALVRYNPAEKATSSDFHMVLRQLRKRRHAACASFRRHTIEAVGAVCKAPRDGCCVPGVSKRASQRLEFSERVSNLRQWFLDE
jgi:hypothetical protein